MTPVDDSDMERGGDETLAAEYVLGVLPAEERRQAVARIESDAAFARIVDEWEGRLSPLAAGYPEEMPPASVKQALDTRLFVPVRTAQPGLFESLAFWRGLSVAALAALAIYIAVPFLQPPAGDESERLVASLAPQESDVHYFVVYDARAQDIGLSHVTGARAEGRDFELWVIGEGGTPVSLGVIPAGSNVHLNVSDQLREAIDAGAAFAISMEPEGGSPTGAPTGPVVAAGELHTI
jgi:anti-sigma-K factor RskA